MGVYDSIRAYNGVISWCNKHVELGTPKTRSSAERHLNNIWIEFGKAHCIKMQRNNSKSYKGDYSPAMGNCQIIQNNWELFKPWMKKNYSKEV
tara:strand:+ start:397 stop:675 length:279 start_codon:yes stop_codon:yes gene_type:complete